MAFGGLGIMMLSGHSALSVFHIALRKVDFQSFFLAAMIFIVILVLAYLTNPSETSFRAYLTEQTFRQHLRRLDDDNQDDQPLREDHGVHYTLQRRHLSDIHLKPSPRSYDSSPPFHFLNRASVSLRTPKHVFRSFGIFTVAAIVPTAKHHSPSPAVSSHSKHAPKVDHSVSIMLTDSWFIGAFGKWWRAGSIHPGWIEAMTNAKDAERCTAGILDVKTLDGLEGYDGLPHFNHLGSGTGPSRDLPIAKFNNRAIATPPQQNGGAHRSTTPPPLPKSASLPLHAPRVPSSSSASASSPPATNKVAVSVSASPSSTGSASSSSSALTLIPSPPQLQPSPSSIFDQSPIIAEILRQITHSERTVYDLRTQLSDFRSAATESKKTIQSDLEAQRERKKAEDASRGEVRSKMKVLEESKRVADGVKRDVEKKLRAAESARDSASQRIGRLDKEIEALKEKMGDDETEMKKKEEEADEEEIQMKEQLEKKKKEIKVAEDVVAALSMRAKELEDKILAEEERLKTAKEQAELRKQDRDFFPLHVVTPDTTTPPIAPWNLPSQTGTQQDPHAFIHSDLSEPIEVFSQSLQQQQHLQHATRSRGGSYSSDSKDLSDPSLSSPRPRKLSLGVISNFRGQPGVIGSEVAAANSSSMVSGNGFSAYGDTIPVDHTLSTRFSPFDHNDVEVSVPVLSTSLGDTSTGDGSMYSGVDSPKSSSLIPTSLIESLAGEDHRPLHLHTQLPLPQQQQHLSRSFQSEDDDILERNWRKTCPFPAHPVESPTTAYTSSSPSSLTNPSFEGVDREDPFEVRAPRPPQATHLQRFIREPLRSSSDPQVFVVGGGTAGGYSQVEENRNEEKGVGHRRWLSSPKVPQPHSSQTQQQQMQMQLQFQEKKGLNPEAKAFQLPKTFGFPTMFHTLPKRHTTLEGNEMHSGHHLSQQQQQFVGAIGSSSAASLSSSSLNLVPSSVFPPSSSALQPGSLPHHPNHTTSNPTSDLPLAVNSNSSTNVSSHHRTLESLFSTISMRAFAPSPAEREALRRGLGSGSGNASLEMLPTLSEVEAIGGGRRSLPPSPSNVPALPNAPALSKMPTSVNVGVVGAIGEGSMRNGGVGGSIKQHQQQASSGLGWLASFPRMRKEKLSPWEDEVVRTSSSGKAVDRGQVGLNGIIGMPVNIRESWDKKRSDGNEGEGDRRMMG